MNKHELISDQSMSAVKRSIVVGIVASLTHFVDNAVEIGRYPEPSWITPAIVLFAWIPLAFVAATALFRKKGDLVFVTLTGIFGVLLLGGLAHYMYESPAHMVDFSNFTIVFEALSGVMLLIALFRSLARK